MKPRILVMNDSKQVGADPTVWFRLERDGTNILLIGVDENGREWSVARICSKGIRFPRFISEVSGIPVNQDGQIVVLP